jgi:hypothetical protein
MKKSFGDLRTRNAAAAFRTDRFIYVESLWGFGQALQSDDAYRVFLDVSSNDHTLGTALLKSLNDSRVVNPFHAEFYNADRIMKTYNNWVEQVKKHYGVKSASRAFRKMEYCEIYREKGGIWLFPHQQAKTARWRDLDDDQAVVIPTTNDVECLGAALRLAFARCI